MTAYITYVSAEQADYIDATVAPAGIPAAHRVPASGLVSIQLSEQAVSILSDLADDSDGHVDSDGILWLGGSEYPLEVVRNA